MKPQSFIFIGRSGSGKGTQAELLIEYLKKIDSAHEIIHIESGGELREFIKGPSYTEQVTKKLYDGGGLIPEFIVVYLWAGALIAKFTGNEHLVFDGMPRKVHEAGALNSIFRFYGLTKPWIINIDISPEESTKRLLARKRFDDNEEEIKKRLDWYESDVVPTMEYYDGNPKYNFLKINGARPVEDIHADIVKKLGLV
jgi:adenylate kinase